MYCKSCRGKVFTMMVALCDCGEEKNSAHKHCYYCAKKKNSCQACGKALPWKSKKAS